MKRMLLVDDEPIFRRGLRSLADWKRLGVEIAGEAINGAEALSLIQGSSVDILVTDLRMPVMDGMELIRRIRSADDRLYIVVLSAFDEFRLVKEAFRAGANDYLLKDDFGAADFDRILAEADIRGRPRTEGDARYRERILGDCLSGVVPPERYAAAAFPDRERAPAGLWVAALRMDVCGPGRRPLSAAELKTALRPGSAEFGFDSTILHDRIPIAALIREAGAEARHADMHAFFAAARAAAAREAAACTVPGQTVHATMGIARGNADSLELCWNDARRALRDSLLWGLGGTADAGQTEARSPAVPRSVDRDRRIRLLASKLDIWDFPGLLAAAGELTLSPKEHRGDQWPQIRELFRDYRTTISLFLRDCPPADRPEIRAVLEEFDAEAAAESDLPSLNGWLRKTLSALDRTFRGKSRLVRQAVALVDQKYGSVISVGSIAARLSTNPSYLSRLCAEELGIPLSEYLTETRIRKAAELIAGGGMKLHEVAAAVGFPNQETFTRCFKRLRGIPPKAFFSGKRSTE